MTSPVDSVRFAVVCQGRVSSWEYEALRRVLQLPRMSLVLLVKLEGNKSDKASPPFPQLLAEAYRKWCHQPAALRDAAAKSLDARWEVPVLTCAALPGATERLDETTVAAFESYQLDFIISFADCVLTGPVLRAAKHGVWVFEHGNGQPVSAKPVGLAEVFRQEPVITATMCRLHGNGRRTVLKQGFFQTKMHSPVRTADAVYEECAHWPADVCRQLLAGLELPSEPDVTSNHAVFQLPSNGAMLAFATRLMAARLRHWHHKYLRADQWNIGVVNRPVGDFLYPEKLRGARVDAPTLPGRNVFYADCFGRPESDGLTVYFEYYNYRVRRGSIARLRYPWEPGAQPTQVLMFPYHLSYPFLFGTYCMPEAWKSHGVRLYDLRAPVTDPAEGLLLLGVPAVDATLLEHEGRYWLFYTRPDRDPMLNLFIAYADALTGPWHEHPRNPVKTDIRGARPAGPFFVENGKLYRPAQDCTHDYGGGVNLHEVIALTPTEYEERTVVSLTSPHPDYPNGMHTVAALDATHTLVDFKRYRFVPFATLLAVWMSVQQKLEKRKRPPETSQLKPMPQPDTTAAVS